MSATLLEDFDILSEWTQGGSAASGAIAETADNVWQASKSLRFTIENSTQDKYITKQVNWDLSAVGGIVLVLYNHIKYGGQALGLQVYLDNQTTVAGDGWYHTIAREFTPGWNVFYIKKTEFTVSGSPNFANPIQSVRFKIYGGTGITRDFTLDSVWTGSHGRPKIVIGFDDGFTDHYVAHQYALSKGIPMTHYLEGTAINEDGYLTGGQVAEMALAGDAICCHDGAQWDGSDGDSGAMMSAQKAALKAYGHIANHASWPQGRYGQYDAEGATVAKSHLMNARTRFLSCRGTGTGINLPISEIANWNGGLRAQPLNNTATLAQAQTYVDDLIAIGGMGAYYGHQFGAADLTHWPQSDFEALCDYIASKADEIDAVTMPELYRSVMGEQDAFYRSSSCLITRSLIGNLIS